jgi:AcrR family transcriptional regulator
VPKIVDHDERRSEVIAAVSRVIARSGIDSSTVRSIAKEAGISTGNLAHYFANKDDILTSALKLSHKRINERWERKLAGLKGMAALRELVLDNLPLDEDRQLETRLEISYWARALALPHVLEVQRAEAATLYDLIVSLIRQARRLGEITSSESTRSIAEHLLALIDGLSLHAILYPDRLSVAFQKRLVERELNKLTGAAEPPLGEAAARKRARRRSAEAKGRR